MASLEKRLCLSQTLSPSLLKHLESFYRLLARGYCRVNSMLTRVAINEVLNFKQESVSPVYESVELNQSLKSKKLSQDF